MGTIYIVYSSTADASAAGTTSTTYSTARAATNATNTTNTTSAVSNSISGANYSCNQAFLVFDTSAVPTGGGTGFFSLNVVTFLGNHNADTVRFRQVSSVANKIAGASLSAQTPILCDPGTFPTGTGVYTASIPSIYAFPRSATVNVVAHTVGEQNGTVPTGLTRFDCNLADVTGTTNDPYIQLDTTGLLWEFVGVSNEVAVATTAHALVTTGISGTLQAGDLLVACITSRIASTTSVTLPTGGEWTLVAEQKNNNTLTTSSALPSGLMAYCVRGASNPNLTFTHPVAPSQAQGRIVAYRNVNTSSPKDTQTSFTTATGTTAVTGTGLTTTQIEDLIVAMACGGQEAAWSAFNATDPAGASGATVTTAPTTTWSERADSLVTTGADGSLAIFDAVKLTSGATGNLTATASVSAGHVVIAGAFKIYAPPAGDGVGDADGVGAASATGASIATGNASTATGTGSASATGTGIKSADASTAAGVGTAAATGSSITILEGVGTAAGIGAASATGVAVGAGVGTAAGIGAASATGAAIGAGAGSAAGIGAATATGVTIGAGVGTAAGIGAATATGSTATAVVSGDGTSAGTGAASATGTAVMPSAGTAAGTSTASGVGRGTSASAGSAAGIGAASASAAVTCAGAGNAVGVGAASATGRSTAAAAGSAAGLGTGAATATVTAASVGTAEGDGTALALSDPGTTTGTAEGIGTAAATGRAITVAVGSAAGVGTASATGAIIAAGVGTASGIGAAAAVSAEAGVIAEAVGTAAGIGEAIGRSLEEQLPVAGGGGIRFRPRPVVIEGVGYGVLPELVGLAIGEVGYRPKLIAGRAKGVVALAGHAFGDIGVKGAAYSVARLPMVASANAAAGSAGQAQVNLSIFKGAAMGHHDPDENVIIALMMAA